MVLAIASNRFVSTESSFRLTCSRCSAAVAVAAVVVVAVVVVAVVATIHRTGSNWLEGHSNSDKDSSILTTGPLQGL